MVLEILIVQDDSLQVQLALCFSISVINQLLVLHIHIAVGTPLLCWQLNVMYFRYCPFAGRAVLLGAALLLDQQGVPNPPEPPEPWSLPGKAPLRCFINTPVTDHGWLGLLVLMARIRALTPSLTC